MMLESGRTRKIAVLGSSGSIGRSALDVIALSQGTLEVVLLSVNRQTNILAEQLQQIAANIASNKLATNSVNKNQKNIMRMPQWIVVTDSDADRAPLEKLPSEILSETKIFYGQDSLSLLVREPEIDIVLSAVSGCAGLASTWSALEAGKIVALANKESLVSGGSMIKEVAEKNRGNLIPVDSEHSAVWQALQSWRMQHYPNSLINPDMNKTANKHSDLSLNPQNSACISVRQNVYNTDPRNVIDNITLTASGGPFRTWTLDELKKVTVTDALNHPTWKMGSKITVDSATMMNKAFEIIEASYLFDLDSCNIKVLIHPQSIVHSMVQFIDGSVVAQLSRPDMRIPISIALHYPERFELPVCPIDWSEKVSLEFYMPDFERFPAISLGYAVSDKGGTAGAVVNAANETAINAFLNGRLPFYDIVNACISVLENHNFEKRPTLSRLLELDTWARKETEKWISQ
ncbi:MAG: 1-deoxy-D-xylulose-5-phosphate reductoisomerase [Planctomycetaceae bacterium]|jgi:1-deoxy-D-xylulose-5-phosphate reductoisomerase|nr:1-deoxy-D-xylulose-5-phosphate reductoisomerase [Planctomycetaceae bacterium]